MRNLENTALVLIDVQNGFKDEFWGERNNPQAEENISRLLKFFRQNQFPIIHIQHLSQLPSSPLHPNKSGVNFMDFALPMADEKIFQKKVNSAFIGTLFEKYLLQHGLIQLVIVGFTTDHCVSTTTRMAANLGFHVLLPSDALATFDRVGPDGNHYSADFIHAVSLASLHNEFAQVVTTQLLLTKQS